MYLRHIFILMIYSIIVQGSDNKEKTVQKQPQFSKNIANTDLSSFQFPTESAHDESVNPIIAIAGIDCANSELSELTEKTHIQQALLHIGEAKKRLSVSMNSSQRKSISESHENQPSTTIK